MCNYFCSIPKKTILASGDPFIIILKKRRIQALARDKHIAAGDQIMPVGNAANRDAAYDAAARADDVAARGELQRAVQLMERACALLPNVRIPWRERRISLRD